MTSKESPSATEALVAVAKCEQRAEGHDSLATRTVAVASRIVQVCSLPTTMIKIGLFYGTTHRNKIDPSTASAPGVTNKAVYFIVGNARKEAQGRDDVDQQ